MALLEPFIDTVVICTMTALVIITTIYDPTLSADGINGIELTASAFASAWSYYGLTAFLFLAGERRWADLGFKLFFLAFAVIGSTIQLGSLVDLADALVFLVALPNLLGPYLLAPRIRKEMLSDEARVRRAR